MSENLFIPFCKETPTYLLKVTIPILSGSLQLWSHHPFMSFSRKKANCV